MLTLALMDNTLRGIVLLIAIVFFCFAAVLAWSWRREGPPLWPVLVALGLALFVLPFCWDAFSLS